MLTIIMPPPPPPAAPDSSQSIIRQVFTRHTHRSCPATGHRRPSESNMATVWLLINPAHSHSSGYAPPITTCPPTWASHKYHTSKPGDSPYISIVAHSSVAATSLHLSTHIPSLTPDPCWGCGGPPVEEEHGHTRCGAEQPLRGRLVLTSDQQH